MRKIFLFLFVLFSTLSFAQPIRSGSYLILNKPHIPPILTPLIPTIAINSPTSGEVIDSAEVFSASVSAADGDGTIDSVVFFVDDVRQAVDVSSPYNYTIPSNAPGDYEFKAIAWDNDQQSVKDSVNYTINSWPLVTITAPTNAQEFTQGTAQTGTVTASDADGTVSYVEFYENDILVGTDVSSPFTQGLTTDGTGTIEFKAIAYDNDGRASIPDSVNFIVNSAPAPAARNWADLDEYMTFSISADSVRSENDVNGAVATNGEEVKFFKDNNDYFQLAYSVSRPGLTQGPDTTVYVVDDPLVDSVRFVYFPNAQDMHYLDNSGVSANLPIHVFHVFRWLRAAKYERLFHGGLTLEDRNFSFYELRWAGSADNNYFTNGNGVAEENVITVAEITVDASGNALLWLNGVPYAEGQSINVGTATATAWGLGTPTHTHKQDVFYHGGVIGGTLNSDERDSVYAIINAIVDTGVVPYYPSAYGATQSYNSTSNVWTPDFAATTRTGGTLDSAEVVWFYEEPGLASGGNFIDDMTPLDTFKVAWTDRFTGTAIDRDDYPQINDDDNHTLYYWVKVRDDNGYWGRYYQSDWTLHTDDN